jgi:hypothetical protein
LLDRLKVARPDASEWNRLQGVYLPLIERWLGRVPGLGVESADLAREKLGLFENAIFLGKSRVLKRLRHEAGAFVINSVFRDRFDAEPAFYLQKQSLDPSPETAQWTPIY